MRLVFEGGSDRPSDDVGLGVDNQEIRLAPTRATEGAKVSLVPAMVMATYKFVSQRTLSYNCKNDK
jgi:hypothetical protein